jgi:hypothetical protein
MCGPATLLHLPEQDASRKEELEKKIAARVAIIEEKKSNILQNPYSKSIYKRCAIKDILGDDQANDCRPFEQPRLSYYPTRRH